MNEAKSVYSVLKVRCVAQQNKRENGFENKNMSKKAKILGMCLEIFLLFFPSQFHWFQESLKSYAKTTPMAVQIRKLSLK